MSYMFGCININVMCCVHYLCFFQAEDGIRDLVRSRGLGDVYKRQGLHDSQLQVRGHQVELRERFAQNSHLRVGLMVLFQLCPDLDQTIATQDQLPDQIHHAVEAFSFHPDRGVFFCRLWLLLLLMKRLIEGALGNGFSLEKNFSQGCLGLRLMLLRLSLIHISEPTRPY